jgi:hypothetical protein
MLAPRVGQSCRDPRPRRRRRTRCARRDAIDDRVVGLDAGADDENARDGGARVTLHLPGAPMAGEVVPSAGLRLV